jgi:hypothetical protein
VEVLHRTVPTGLSSVFDQAHYRRAFAHAFETRLRTWTLGLEYGDETEDVYPRPSLAYPRCSNPCGMGGAGTDMAATAAESEESYCQLAGKGTRETRAGSVGTGFGGQEASATAAPSSATYLTAGPRIAPARNSRHIISPRNVGDSALGIVGWTVI